jgi:sugar O-acyltransferase (sialic acid O-acetyltransferase NeuD family)
MCKKKHGVLLVGCGGHARFVLSILKSNGCEVAGLIDLEDAFDSAEVIMNVSVVGCRSALPEFRSQGFEEVVIAVGDNAMRKTLYNEVTELGFKLPCVIHASAIVDKSVLMGVGNIIGPNVIIGAEVKIGLNNIINSAATVEHQSVIGSHCHVALSSVICGAVHIGDEVFVGANSTVIDKISIGDKVIVGSGANVIRNVYDNGVTLVGNPSRAINK